jgi:hypothetical protein
MENDTGSHPIMPLVGGVRHSESLMGNILTLSAPNDIDLRFAVFLLWAKQRRSTSKYLNFPPYDVTSIKLKSMISATNIAAISNLSNQSETGPQKFRKVRKQLGNKS